MCQRTQRLPPERKWAEFYIPSLGQGYRAWNVESPHKAVRRDHFCSIHVVFQRISAIRSHQPTISLERMIVPFHLRSGKENEKLRAIKKANHPMTWTWLLENKLKLTLLHICRHHTPSTRFVPRRHRRSWRHLWQPPTPSHAYTDPPAIATSRRKWVFIARASAKRSRTL